MGEDEPASTTSTPSSSRDVVEAYDRVVGGKRYVQSRTIDSGSLLQELDIHDLTSSDVVRSPV